MTRATIVAALAAGLALASLPAPASAQSLGWFNRDPSAPLAGAMTEAQARRACQRELRGTRESRAAIRTKMRICMNGKMQGR